MHKNTLETGAGPRWLLDSGVRHAHLKIGECITAEYELLVSTVLGSCVSAAFHHPTTGLSAMFHAMLPRQQLEPECSTPCKFVDGAIELIADWYAARRVKPALVEVKLFGGGCILIGQEKKAPRNIVDVGSLNVDQARQALSRHGFTVRREHVLGRRGRKLYFHTKSGAVWMKLLPGRE